MTHTSILKNFHLVLFAIFFSIPLSATESGKKTDTVPNPYAKPSSTKAVKGDTTIISTKPPSINKPPPTFNTGTTNQGQPQKQPPPVPIKEFKVPGLLAWSEAKKNGFKFYPKEATGNRDGSNSWGESYYTTSKGNKKSTKGSQVIGGVNMLVHNKYRTGFFPKKPLEITGYFRIFSDKRLRPGWKIKSINITGNYEWTKTKYRRNTQIIRTMIKIVKPAQVSKASTAMIKEIVLIGPKNGQWQDAFSAR